MVQHFQTHDSLRFPASSYIECVPVVVLPNECGGRAALAVTHLVTHTDNIEVVLGVHLAGGLGGAQRIGITVAQYNLEYAHCAQYVSGAKS